MRCPLCLTIVAFLTIGQAVALRGDDAAALRLVPFPKKVELRQGTFSLEPDMVLELPAASCEVLGTLIAEEVVRAGFRLPDVRPLQGDAKIFRLSFRPGENPMPPMPAMPTFRDKAIAQDYVLEVQPESVIGASPGEVGLDYAAQTLCQLIRANRRGAALPCLSISDWPSMEWRIYQDDMTRGPSAKLGTLEKIVDVGAALKMNVFTGHIEHQFAFKKRPIIGPKNGSLTPEDLTALVTYAKLRGIDILGMQQSFGHFYWILRHPEFAACAENQTVLSPVKEETYQLLDDMYSEMVPLVPFPWFNVCCDEVEGLGEGPSKELVAKIGAGGVYVQHMRRIHDLMKDKYGKRIMMWGDIILRHPDKLDQIPKDTIMLTWAYDPRPNFDSQILPFAESGYDFVVCPSTDAYNRILPNYTSATTNVYNFVRDGAKHHALGMLNTEWKDDAETLHHAAWHGYAFGAECSWNASTTTPEDFNRRIGAVLFGEKGDHFGQAIVLLGKTHQLTGPGMAGMFNARYWQNDFSPKGDEAAIRTSAEELLAIVNPAIEHLEACRKDAVVNTELIDPVLFGAKRMRLIGQRTLDGLAAIHAYAEAAQAAGKDEKLAKLTTVEELVRRNRDTQESLGKEYTQIWLRQSKLYSLDWAMRRYAEANRRYDDLLAKVADAKTKAEAGQPLPQPAELGLVITPGSP